MNKPEGCYYSDCMTCDGWLSLEGGVVRCPEKRHSVPELWRLGVPKGYKPFIERPYTVPPHGTPAQIKAITALLKRLERARAFWAKPRNRGVGVGIHGPVGSGKTHLAMKFAEAYVEVTGRPVAVMSEQEYLAAFSVTRGGMESLGGGKYFLARETKALLLDDLGSSRYTDARAAELSDLITHLHLRNVMLIWTANLPIQDAGGVEGLETRGIVDARAASRLAEMCVPMSTDGLPDWRLQNQEKLLTNFAGVK